MPKKKPQTPDTSVAKALKDTVFPEYFDVHHRISRMLGEVKNGGPSLSSYIHLARLLLNNLSEVERAVEKSVKYATKCREFAGMAETKPLVLGVFAETTTKENLIISIGCPYVRYLNDTQRWLIANGMSTRWGGRPEEVFFIRGICLSGRPTEILPKNVKHNHSSYEEWEGFLIQAFLSYFVKALEARNIQICERPYIVMDDKNRISLLSGKWMLAAQTLDFFGVDKFNPNEYLRCDDIIAAFREKGLPEGLAQELEYSEWNDGDILDEMKELQRNFTIKV